MNSLFALFAGILLGIGQLLMRHIFSESNKSLFLIPIIFVLFFAFWNYMDKVIENMIIYHVYDFNIGLLLSIIMGNQILISKKFIIYTKEVITIFLISTGCYLLKPPNLNNLFLGRFYLFLFLKISNMFC